MKKSVAKEYNKRMFKGVNPRRHGGKQGRVIREKGSDDFAREGS